MSNPTTGTYVFGLLAIVARDNTAAVALSILAIGCWINKSLEELKMSKELIDKKIGDKI